MYHKIFTYLFLNNSARVLIYVDNSVKVALLKLWNILVSVRIQVKSIKKKKDAFPQLGMFETK